MPTKIGNKISYEGDKYMDNGGGGFPPFGFARIPSQQVKVDESKELGELVQQYKTSVIVIFVVMSFVYVSTNLALGLADWYQVVTGLEILLSFLVFVFMRRALMARFEGRDFFGDANGTYLSTNTILAFLIGLVVFIYVKIQATDFLVVLFRFPEDAQIGEIIKSVARTGIIFFTASLIVPSIAMFIRLVIREIPDNFHGAVELQSGRDKLDLDWARFQEDNERYWSGHEVIDQLPSAAPQKLLGHHIVTNPAAARSISPRAEDQYFNMVINEFLDGIENGQWSTSERSWKKKRLVLSGVDLPVVGDEIRDTLIGGRWAEWVHPNQPHLGWRLVAPISEIRNKALLQDKKQLPPPIEEPDTVAKNPNEWNPEDEQTQ